MPSVTAITIAAIFAIVALSQGPLCDAVDPDEFGPYEVDDTVFNTDLVSSIGFWYPTGVAAGEKFPLIEFSHGAFAGIRSYTRLAERLASHGFVVGLHSSCSLGCGSGTSDFTICGGPTAPATALPLFQNYFSEIFKVITFAKEESEKASPGIFGMIDWDVGVGIAGHSMGGQSTAVASRPSCTGDWEINAAVMMMMYDGTLTTGGNIGEVISVPSMFMTNDNDAVADTQDTLDAYNAMSNNQPKLFRKIVGYSHNEPLDNNGNVFLGTYAAAWFKIFLLGDRGAYYDLIYGDNADSLCNYAEMEACYYETLPDDAGLRVTSPPTIDLSSPATTASVSIFVTFMCSVLGSL